MQAIEGILFNIEVDAVAIAGCDFPLLVDDYDRQIESGPIDPWLSGLKVQRFGRDLRIDQHAGSALGKIDEICRQFYRYFAQREERAQSTPNLFLSGSLGFLGDLLWRFLFRFV